MSIKSYATTSVALLLIAPVAAYAEKPTPVEVVNADPIPVTVSSPPPDRFQRSLVSATWTPLTDGTSDVNFVAWQVPDDKTLVMEYISANAIANPGDMAYLDVVCQGVDVAPALISMPLTSAGIYGTKQKLVVGAAIKCYAGTTMFATVRRTSDIPVAGGGISVSIVGYLLDKPQ